MLKKILEKGFREAVDFVPTLYWDENSSLANKDTNLNTMCFRLEDKDGNYLYNNFFGVERYIGDLVLGTVDFERYRETGDIIYCEEIVDLLFGEGISLEKIKDQILKSAGLEAETSSLDITRTNNIDELKISFDGFPSVELFRVEDKRVSISYIISIKSVLRKALLLQEEQAQGLLEYLSNPSENIPRDVSMVAWRRFFAAAENGFNVYGSIALNRDKAEGIIPKGIPDDLTYFAAVNTGETEVYIPYSKVRGIPYSILPFCNKEDGLASHNAESWVTLYYAGVFRVDPNTCIHTAIGYDNLETIDVNIKSPHLTLTSRVIYKRNIRHGSRKATYQKAS